MKRLQASLLLSMLLVVPFFLSFSVRNAYAASYTATQSGNWDDPSTWGLPAGTTAPTTINSGDTATIPNGLTVTIASGVTVSDSGTIAVGSGGVVDVAPGGTLTVNTGGTVKIAGATSTCAITRGSVSNSGTITVNSGGSIAVLFGNCIPSSPASIENYGSLNINSGGVLSEDSGGLISTHVGGTINNSGTITSCPANTINNSGTLNNYNVIYLCPGNSFGNWGTVNNYLGGTITSQSFVYNFAGGAINDYGVINNTPSGCPEGIISNSGAIRVYSGGILNNTQSPGCGVGTIGINTGGTLTIDSGGTFVNSAVLNLNTGSTETFSGPSAYSGAFSTAGTFTTLSGAKLELGGSGTALIVSSGTLSIPSGVTLQVNSGASLTVTSGATLSNGGALALDSGTTITFSGPSTYSGFFTNNGTFSMLSASELELGSGTALAVSSGTFSVPAGVTLQVDGGASVAVSLGDALTNDGTLNSYGTFTSDGTVTNNAGGTINNHGAVNNNAVSTISNNGSINNYATINTPGALVNNATIKNYCGAVINGTVTGNPVINACVRVTLASSSSCAPPRFGQPITFTATVSPSTATGAVAFLDGATTLATSPLSGGTSTLITSLLSVGTHSITAVYGGDPIDIGATSAPLSQLVLPSWSFPTATAALVDNSPGDQTDPHVSGNLLAYSSFDGANLYIKYVDLTTGCVKLVPNGGSFDFLSDVSGSRIAFTRVDSSRSAIDLFDTSTPSVPPVEIDSQAGSVRQSPQIGGDTVAWQDFGSYTNGASDIVVWDMATSRATRLTSTSNGHFNQFPGLSPDGSAVVWQDCTTFTSCNIFDSVQTTTDVWSAPYQLTTTGTCSAIRPDTNGYVAVYSCSDSAGVGHVYIQPLGGGQVTQIAFSGSAENPSITGSWVSFSGEPTGVTTHGIYLYNIGTGALSQVPTPPGDNTLDDVSTLPSGQVNLVWNNFFQTSFAIYAFGSLGDFSLGPVSPMTVGVGGSASTPVTVHSVSGFSSSVTLTPTGMPGGITASFSPNPVAPPSGSSISSTLTVTVQPFVTPQTFTLTVTASSTSPPLTHSTSVSVSVVATTSSTSSVINSLLVAGCINNAGVANSFISKLSAAQANISVGNYADAINTLKALLNQLQAQAGKHLSTSCTINGVTFNPVTVLTNDVQSLIDTLSTTITPNPITGYVVTSTGTMSGVTVGIFDSSGHQVATATTDVTGFYFLSDTSILTDGSAYTIEVTGIPTGFTTSSPPSQTFTWSGTATVIGNFVLS